MLKTVQQRFALSTKGAKDFCKGTFFTILLDLALMLPAVYAFLFLDDYVRPLFDPSRTVLHGVVYYILLALAFVLVMYVTSICQYRSAYTAIYGESANRRIALAEKLRRLPLAFFGEKNLSDLTSTIMDDCTDLEHTFSHAVPQLFASLISIALIAVGMFFYNWQLSLALFWVMPFALAAILLSKRKISREFGVHYRSKRDVTEHIQEGLDTIREIKSCNRESDYLAKLDLLTANYEKTQTKGELLTGVLVNSATSFMKLGLAGVIIVGARLVSNGTVDLFTYLIFMVIGSRIYAPVH